MGQRLGIAAGTLFLAGGLLGCEDAGKRPVQARVPALAPAATPQQAPAELGPLPVLNPPRRQYVWLLPPIPAGEDYLFPNGQEKFASGEQKCKTCPIGAARKG